MLRYASHHNYEKKAVRKSHEKTKSNKRKSKRDPAPTEDAKTDLASTYSSKAFKSTKHHPQSYEEEEGNDYFKTNYGPKTWKDSWQRPLNQNLWVEDNTADTNVKIRTSKVSKRQNNRKNTFTVDMLTSE